MARPKNTLKTVQVTISTTEQVKDVLEALTNSGMYGKNAADTAQRLMLERIRDLQQTGMAPRPTFNGSTVVSNDDN
ncbi:MAG: hypothetical protein ACKVJU_09315 [Verrucomicrobiales bacterium]|jgi:hypothetical protein|nr:hypothetical protein [Verrucomicrobiales bacterium]MDC0321746.1 hypothetical protein [Verrucomicrobiales bacterium]